MPLTDLQARKAKPKEKDYKLSAEKGLFLLVKKNGSKYWRMKYRYHGKEKLLSFGVYPEVTLSEARERRDSAREQLRNELDPGLEKKKRKIRQDPSRSFRAIAEEWLKLQEKTWRPNHAARVRRSLELNIFPFLGRCADSRHR